MRTMWDMETQTTTPSPTPRRPPDVTIASTGARFTFTPTSPRARRWMAENAPSNEAGVTIVVGMLGASHLILQMALGGLEVR